MPELERVHRALARAGVASRRAAERMVAEGRVSVNGESARVGQKIAPGDVLEVDGRPVTAERPAVFLVNKKRGVISTAADPQGRPTVVDELPIGLRLYPVGRLDRDTTGALLVTNDGELAHRLMHPRHGMTKEYEVLVKGRVSEAVVRRLRRGVELEDGVTRPAGVERMSRRAPACTWLRFRLSEGRNRQIRRMGEAVGHPVIRLHRPAYAGLDVGTLEPGAWRELASEEVGQLASTVGLAR
ncbi:MAG: rRNA pseudouridine synthase [Thermoleophilia bacterium]|nr:rRNA pseudouridine synthase [Thermoleophilia bacterium]